MLQTATAKKKNTRTPGSARPAMTSQKRHRKLRKGEGKGRQTDRPTDKGVCRPTLRVWRKLTGILCKRQWQPPWAWPGIRWISYILSVLSVSRLHAQQRPVVLQLVRLSSLRPHAHTALIHTDTYTPGLMVEGWHSTMRLCDSVK